MFPYLLIPGRPFPFSCPSECLLYSHSRQKSNGTYETRQRGNSRELLSLIAYTTGWLNERRRRRTRAAVVLGGRRRRSLSHPVV